MFCKKNKVKYTTGLSNFLYNIFIVIHYAGMWVSSYTLYSRAHNHIPRAYIYRGLFLPPKLNFTPKLTIEPMSAPIYRAPHLPITLVLRHMYL